MNTNAGFQNLAPPMGAPLDPNGDTALTPPAPTGWKWYQIDGAVCRDGTPTGMFVHVGTADKLYIFLEGGGACSSPGFCTYNPQNVNMRLNGDGQTVAGSIGGQISGRQQPGAYTGGVLQGIYDTTKAENPFKDWSGIYIPYCTGDVHFGTNENGTITGLPAQKFVGYKNMQKFIGRIVPTFKDTVKRVVLTGTSAGGFGAALNFSMVQDAFGQIRVDVLDDSGPPFADEFSPICMQKKWRELWGFAASLPPDCEECKQADGGGLVRLAEFLMKKHSNATVAMVSATQDEIIRLFYSSGLRDCVDFATADPVTITLAQADPAWYVTGAVYTSGLTDLRQRYKNTGRFATYFIGGANQANHQHIWRDRFYQPVSGNKTIAQFVTDFLNGTMADVGP